MYSQYGEDDLFLPLLPEHGRLLDVGAGQPKRFSNSRALIERGWEAVLVEPSPSLFLNLFEEYRNHSLVKLINCAIGNEWGLRRFHYNDEFLSTTEEKHYEHWRTYAGANYLGVYTVATVPLTYLVEERVFDFISIDVEGASADLFPAAMAAHPKAICIEHDNRVDWIMRQAPGYRQVFRNGVNLVLAR